MPTAAQHRRWTVIASGALCGLLALVVLFTKPQAFYSPSAVVVVAAIGLAAVLLQLRLRNQEHPVAVQPPVWLNALGIGLALMALFSDWLHLGRQVSHLVALGAIGSFAISSAIILHAFRKERISRK